MPSALDTTKEIQNKVYAGLEVGQQAVVACVRSWAETVETVFSKVPELTFADPIKPSQFFENAVGFTQKVLDSQRDFANQVFEAALPATKASASAAKTAASKSSP